MPHPGTPSSQKPPTSRFLESLDRRRFLEVSGVGAVALVLGTAPFTGRTTPAARLGKDPFTLGVTSGDPLPSSVVLWTRLAPEPLDGEHGGMPDAAVEVEWELAEDERFAKIVRRGTELARPDLGHSVHVEAGGLRAGREYYYRFRAGSHLSPVGRTKTALARSALNAGLTFAFASCQQFEHGYFTAYRHMADEDLDLIVHLGDYIYEYGTDEYTAPGGNVRHHVGPEITTLADYRRRHAQYRGDADLRAAHAHAPWIVTWDDHEVENNYAAAISENRGEDPEVFLRRRAAAYQAYYEHMPLRRSSMPKGPDMRLYRRFSYGRLAEFSVLDTRQYRSDQAADDGIKPPGDEQADPARSLMGRRQERWLTDGLSASDARWNILAQQVFFARLDFTPGEGETFNMDAWDGYLANRERLLEHIDRRGVRNPVVLTGDVHASWASEVAAEPRGRNLATEFVGTSITSGGDGSDVRAETPALLAENPHIKFFNNYRGYVRCTVTPETYRADYRVVPYVKTPGAPIVTRASFEVADGRPALEHVGGSPVKSGAETVTHREHDRIATQRDLAG
ncbi:MAG: alkaline phosphatase [Streptosporangiales bacterium]|nr:alkaline phosphatase [Streptosporangiales bacterium]